MYTYVYMGFDQRQANSFSQRWGSAIAKSNRAESESIHKEAKVETPDPGSFEKLRVALVSSFTFGSRLIQNATPLRYIYGQSGRIA